MAAHLLRQAIRGPDGCAYVTLPHSAVKSFIGASHNSVCDFKKAIFDIRTSKIEDVQCVSIIAEGAYERWSSAVGNIEDAKVAVDIMARAIEDAVYLDEDAYNQMIPMQQYTRTIEVSSPSSPYALLQRQGLTLPGAAAAHHP